MRTHTRHPRVTRNLIGLVAVGTVVLSSCLTARDPLAFDYAPLFGMIYDAENEPVSAAVIIVNDVDRYQSGVMGRVVIPDLQRGTHRFTVTKDGYEPAHLEVEFASRSHVLYVRMVSFESLLSEAEGELQRGRFDRAMEYLDRASAVDPDDPRTIYLRALLAYRRRNAEEAVCHLQALVTDGTTTAFVHLLAADVHQYLLEDSEQAAASLREYLRMRADSDVERRLTQLVDEAAANGTSAGR